MAPPSSSTRSRKKISGPIQTLLLKEEPRPRKKIKISASHHGPASDSELTSLPETPSEPEAVGESQPENLADSLQSISNAPSQTPLELLQTRARQRLSQYTSQARSDDTVRVLESFLDHLPAEGSRVIGDYILHVNDDEQLSYLSNHLYVSILAPGRSFHSRQCFFSHVLQSS